VQGRELQVRVRDKEGGRNISFFLARLSAELDFGCGYKLVVMVSALGIIYSPLLSIFFFLP
jgi:hypothetical protein